MKHKSNILVTAMLFAGAGFVILLPLYMTVMIAIKDPSDMNQVLALPKKIRLLSVAGNGICHKRIGDQCGSEVHQCDTCGV